MSDQWRDIFRHPQDPATNGFAITAGPSEFTQPTRALWVGADGDITLVTVDGVTLTLAGAKAGSLIPIRAKKVTAFTGTGLVGLY